MQCCFNVYVFRTDHLVLERLSSFLRNTDSLSAPINCLQLFMGRVGPGEIFRLLLGMSAGVAIVQALFRQPYC